MADLNKYLQEKPVRSYEGLLFSSNLRRHYASDKNHTERLQNLWELCEVFLANKILSVVKIITQYHTEFIEV